MAWIMTVMISMMTVTTTMAMMIHMTILMVMTILPLMAMMMTQLVMMAIVITTLPLTTLTPIHVLISTLLLIPLMTLIMIPMMMMMIFSLLTQPAWALPESQEWRWRRHHNKCRQYPPIQCSRSKMTITTHKTSMMRLMLMIMSPLKVQEWALMIMIMSPLRVQEWVGTHLNDDKPPESTGVAPQDDGNSVDEHQEELDLKMSARYGPCTGWYDMWQHKKCNYSHLFIETVDDKELYDTDSPLATAQMSMKKGIQMFGEEGVAAIKKEMQQLHDQKVMAAKHSSDLTPEQKKEALTYLMFLKQKWCGKIKGWGCTNGRKQHAYIACKDMPSPTVATKLVF